MPRPAPLAAPLVVLGLALLAAGAPSGAAHVGAPRAFDVATHFSAPDSGTLAIHYQPVWDAGNMVTLARIEAADGSLVCEIRTSATTRWLSFSDGFTPEGARRWVEGWDGPRASPWGNLLVVRFDGATYRVTVNERETWTMRADQVATPTRAWAPIPDPDPRLSLTTLQYFRVLAADDLVVAGFADPSPPGWSWDGSALGRAAFEPHASGHHGVGALMIEVRPHVAAAHAASRVLGTTSATYAAGVDFRPWSSRDLADRFALLAGLRPDGSVAWAVTRTDAPDEGLLVGPTPYRARLEAVDGDGSATPLGIVSGSAWRSLDVRVDGATGAWSVRVDGALVGGGKAGSGATRLALGDVLGGLLPTGGTGAGAQLFDHAWSMGTP